MSHREIIEMIYIESMKEVAKDEYESGLVQDIERLVQLIVSRSEANRGLIAVITTLLVHKIVDCKQDIRYHQAQQDNGFAGRGIDTEIITPFMKRVSFPSMSESGWLTRSLEQPHPYTLDYPGKIKPDNLKSAFLQLVDAVQVQNVNAKRVLQYLFVLLIKQRDELKIELAKPHSLSISTIVKLLENHFTYPYTCSGASRLPTLAIYASYQCMMDEVARFEEKTLCPLVAHNSADRQSGRIGDIDIHNNSGSALEGVEIKHGIVITQQIVADAYEKFKNHKTERYYILTTHNMDLADWESIEGEVNRIRKIHGCQVIVNGVYSTLKYYLRLLKDPSEFIEKYVELLQNDETVKFQHKAAWNEIISKGE